MKTITIATGNTYNAKTFLRQAGFEWTGSQWIYSGSFDKNTWITKYANPTYNGRKNAKLCENINFEIKDMIN